MISPLCSGNDCGCAAMTGRLSVERGAWRMMDDRAAARLQ